MSRITTTIPASPILDTQQVLVAGRQTETIGWYTNLARGLHNCLLHFLFPLNNFGFNYDCLFSDKPECLVDKSPYVNNYDLSVEINQPLGHRNLKELIAGGPIDPRNHSSIIKSPASLIKDLGHLLNGFLDKIPILGHYLDRHHHSEKLHPRMDKASGLLANRWFVTLQLILCTTLLSVYLARDVPKLWKIYQQRSRTNGI